MLAADLNITSELVYSASFGKLDRGKWGGVVGLVQDGSVDVTLVAMSATFARC